MPIEILVQDHHKLTYSQNSMMVAQQLQNPLRGAVTIVPASGEAMSANDLFGKKDYKRGEERSRTNPETTTPRSRRWLVRPLPIEDGEYIDKVDVFDQLMNPSSTLMRGSIAAVERGVFDTILGIEPNGSGGFTIAGNGILGSATTGKRPDTRTALPGGNVIGASATGLTLDKLRKVKKDLKKADFGLEDDDPLWCAITPGQEDDLIGIAATSGPALNTFTIEQLKSGKPTTLLGINWIVTNRLPTNASGHRQCPVWSKKNIVVGVWQDVQSRIWNNPAAKNLPYMFTDAWVDAVRIQDGGVRVIECTES